MLSIVINDNIVRPEQQYSSIVELKSILKEQFQCKDVILSCNGSELDDTNKWSLIGPYFTDIVVTGVIIN